MLFTLLNGHEIIQNLHDGEHIQADQALQLMSIQLEISIINLFAMNMDGPKGASLTPVIQSKTAIFKAPLQDIRKECIEDSIDGGEFEFDGKNWGQIWGPPNDEITLRMVFYR